MKRFGLLQMWHNGNKELMTHVAKTVKEAIAYFQSRYPTLQLNEEGYAKFQQPGDFFHVSYCVGEHYQHSFQSAIKGLQDDTPLA